MRCSSYLCVNSEVDIGMKINYLDLFSGCGGFRKGLEEAGFTFGWEGHSEIDRWAKQVYTYHFPESEELGDIKLIQPEELPRLDLITFGFPCQDLSVAGKRGGLKASRSGLFYEAMRLVRATKPDYFIFENVKGLFSSRGGLDWLNVLREIANAGYDGQWQLLNTRTFTPQNRERIYFVGYFTKTGGRKIFPIEESSHEIIRDRTIYRGGSVYIETPGVPWVSRPQNIAFEESGCIRKVIPHGVILKDGKIRLFTPIEVERLNGYPDHWTAFGTTGMIEDKNRYEMMGNTVSVPVVKAVAERLINQW